MNPDNELGEPSREEIMSALFANMVIQQTNMALMLLGKVPHPETGELIRDVESARMFIEQLEMLEVKTKGNLDKREEGLLKQSLTAVRMSFVEAVEGRSPEPTPARSAAPGAPAPAPNSPPPQSAPAPSPAPVAEEESRKKFTKKY